METIKVKLVKAHEDQMGDLETEKELKSVQNFLDQQDCDLLNSGVGILFLKGVYRDFEKKMTALIVLINHTGKEINELHGIIKFQSPIPIQIAKTIIDFDKEFMGAIDHNEAILVHLNIPLKGLSQDREFYSNDLICEFSDVRVTYVSA